MSITSNAKNDLNRLKFWFLLQILNLLLKSLFERKSLNSLTYTGMPLYPGIYRYMVNLILYRHTGLCGVIRYNKRYQKYNRKQVDVQYLCVWVKAIIALKCINIDLLVRERVS